MAMQRQLRLNLVANDLNLHQGAYEYERVQGIPERSVFERLLEYGAFGDEGLFTALFVGDIPGMQGSPAFDGGPAEPITALTAISQRTKHVGLIATASTTFYDPYNLARLLASLDQVSDGRAGYNAVTSVIDRFAQNYSLRRLLDRAARYQRADEFLQVLRALWDNRELRRDPDGRTRFYAEPIDHQGKLFQVTGPLNIAPSRQHRPLIAQAGGSGPGIEVAAKHADMVFTNSSTRAGAAGYREALDKALIDQGRPRVRSRPSPVSSPTSAGPRKRPRRNCGNWTVTSTGRPSHRSRWDSSASTSRSATSPNRSPPICSRARKTSRRRSRAPSATTSGSTPGYSSTPR